MQVDKPQEQTINSVPRIGAPCRQGYSVNATAYTAIVKDEFVIGIPHLGYVFTIVGMTDFPFHRAYKEETVNVVAQLQGQGKEAIGQSWRGRGNIEIMDVL